MQPRSPRAAWRRAWRRPPIALTRAQAVILLALAGLTGGAWTLTVFQARGMTMPMGLGGHGGGSNVDGMGGMAMAGMTGGDWSLHAGVSFLAIWTVMMAAMMLPAIAPMLVLFGAIHAKRRPGGAFVPTWVFAAGYLLVWAATGVLVYLLVQAGRDGIAGLSAARRDTWAPLALGATLVVAGLYQLTPLKRVCLAQCQSPLGFVMSHWREGWRGALRMGVDHGAYCLGCCWALFAVLVAAGLMSLAWMALLTLVIFAEKVIPHGQCTAAAVGIALVALGILVAAGSTAMPWVT